MKNNVLKYMACAAMALGLAANVQAALIIGSIGFNGSFTQDGTQGDLTTATNLTIINPVVTPGTATYDFSGAGAPVFASPIGVNGSLLPMSGPLWSVTVGLKTYTMTVLTEAETLDTAIQLNFEGVGIVSDGIPADNTTGVWLVGFDAGGTPPASKP